MWLLTIQASFDQVQNLEKLFEEQCVSISWFEKNASQNIWELEAIFDEEPSLSYIKNIVEDLSYTLAPLPKIDWLAENRKAFPPLKIGNFFITNSYYEGILPQDAIIFKIDAATAFGTGQHATTRSCLRALEDLKNESFEISNFLDLGCGTAILAMGMARLFNIKGLACDNDLEAVEKALFNCEDNSLDDQISVIHSEGFSSEIVQTTAPYDLIAANILAAPLIDLASEMKYYLSSSGFVVLSGLLHTQQSKVQQAYESQDFITHKNYIDQEWSTLVMKKI